MNAKDNEIDEKVRASYQAALSKDYEKAIALCREAIDLDPACYQAWYNLASFGRYRAVSILRNEALPAYDKAIEFCSDDYILLKEKAEILYFLEKKRRQTNVLDGTDNYHLPFFNTQKREGNEPKD